MTMIDELGEKKSPEMKELNQKQNDVEKTSVSDRFYLKHFCPMQIEKIEILLIHFETVYHYNWNIRTF